MLDSYVLTIDTDWAPDCAIEAVTDMLLKKKTKATWFITHDSPSIRRLFKHDDIFEFGLHPNFLPESTQGKNENEVMEYLRAILPDSRILRTHTLYQSSRLLAFLTDKFNIEIDVSIFLPSTARITPHTIRFNGSKNELLRMPYFWEDDVEMCAVSRSWDITDHRYHVPGLKIFDFHPMYVYLNSDTMKDYVSLKTKGPLFRLKEEEIAPFINRNGEGAGSFFRSFVEYMLKEQKVSYKISDIASAWAGEKARHV